MPCIGPAALQPPPPLAVSNWLVTRWGRTLSPTVPPISLRGSKTGSKRSRLSVENGARRSRFLRPQFRDPSGDLADLELRDLGAKRGPGERRVDVDDVPARA